MTVIKNKSDEEILTEIQNSVVGSPKVVAESDKQPDENPEDSKKVVVPEKKEDEKPAENEDEKKPDEDGAKTPPPKDSTNPDDEGNKSKNRPERFIPADQYNARKKKWEETLKGEQDARLAAETKAKELEAELLKLKDPNLSSEEKKDINAELATLAEEIGIEPEKLEKMKNIFSKSIKPSGLSEEDKQLLTSIKSKSKEDEEARLEKEEKEYFQKEWTETLPIIEKTFTNTTPEKKKEAMEFMDKISHTTKYQNLTLPEVFELKKEEFAKILSVPKRKTFENSDKGFGQNEEVDLSKKNIADMTPKELAQYEKGYRDAIPKERSSVNRQGNVTVE